MILLNGPILSISSWWHAFSGVQQFLWSLALVSTFLSILFLILYFSGLGQDDEPAHNQAQTRTTRWALLAFTVGSWAGVLSDWLFAQGVLQLLTAALAGLLAVGLRWWVYREDLRKQHRFKIDQALTHTGKVLRSIPPHRAGIGKVHLHLRSAPFEIDAVTMGDQIRPGQYVRVVEVEEEGVLRVEPLPDRPPRPSSPRKKPVR